MVTPLSSAVGSDVLSAISIGSTTFFSDYGAAGVYALTSPSSATLVVGGIVHAHQMTQAMLPQNLSLKLAGGNVMVSWPYGFSTYHLQAATSLNPANWQTVVSAPMLVGNSMQVTLPGDG